ncbi:MAG: hypothetical protein AAFV51_04960 [Pseudomonadota bacterium]
MPSPEHAVSLVLIAIHWTPLALATWLWPLRPRPSVGSALALIVCIPSALIVVACLFVFTDVEARSATAGHAAGWYLIFSVITLGVVPAIVLSAHLMAGRLAGWALRRRAA